VGEPGRVIAETAAALGIDLVVMGGRGLGTHTGGLLGSAATSALQQAPVPVLVVRD
jgi:nucleotide-binding universal stress UspA family protein